MGNVTLMDEKKRKKLIIAITIQEKVLILMI